MPPGLLVVVLILCGTALGLLTDIPIADAAAVALALGSFVPLARTARARGLLLLGVIAAIAASDAAWARDRTLSSPLQDWIASVQPDDRGGDAIEVHGVLAEDASIADHGVRLVLDVDQLRTRGGWRPLAARVQAHVTGDLAIGSVSTWTAGRIVTAPMVLRQPQTFRNPGSPSLRWQRLRRTADLLGTIKSAPLVQVQHGPVWREAAAAVRRRVRAACAQYIAPRSVQSAAIVSAILIGDRAGLAPEVQRQLRTAGTFHVIAISGGNVALLTVVCFATLRVLVRSFRTQAIVTILFVVSYGWLVGGDPSVRRAVAAAVLYLLLGLVGLRPRPLGVVATVAGALALTDPLIAIDTGAWLSFMATLGIVLCASRFMIWAAGPSTASSSQSVVSTVMTRAWRATLGLFSATLAAELMLLPISAAVFSRVGVFGLVLNFIAIPAMAVVQVAGLLMVAADGWWRRGAIIAGWVSERAATLLVGSSGVVDVAPWLSWRVPPVSPWWTVTFYAGVFVFLSRRTWDACRVIALVTTSLAAVVIVTAPTLEQAGPGGGRLRVTMIDVGQGDSILVQFPQGQSMLVDAGGARSATDFGARVVTPALWALGVRRLDWLALTHGDIDHVGGALDIAQDLRPREIWEGVPVPGNPELRSLRIDAQARHIVWRQVLAGHTFEVGSVQVRVVHPPPPDWERQRIRNDDSLVLRIVFGDVDVWLTGDAGGEFESLPRSNARRMPLRLLKVGHHGSRTSSSEAFVQSMSPDVAFVSAGRGNPFGHPAPEVIARYERLGAKVFRTDQDGAIVIETDGATVTVETMSGRTWRFVTGR